MITASFFTSVEFYVIAAAAAAAIIGLCIRPASKGEAASHLLAGILCYATEATDEVPTVDIECQPDGNVLLTRRGLSGITTTGAVSLGITVTGFDITIEERLTASAGGEPVNTALFTLDFLGRERYHVRYNSESTGMFCAFPLHNSPGIHTSRKLSQ